MALDTLKIRSGQGDYPVDFQDEIADVVSRLEATPKAMLVLDRKIAQLYERPLGALTRRIPTLLLDATEENKSLAGVTQVCAFLQGHGATRQSRLIVLGGGIVQDIASFAAHIWFRGMQWTFVPTTLLSMSDSCIGAKCGINFNGFKNQLGFFHAPARVLICPRFVETLAEADVASGYGEILKLAFTGSAQHLDRLAQAVARTGGLRNTELARLIRDSLEVKKCVIEEDEYEKDRRRILNYGHTFGHALETLTHHEIPHGLAVAWGMDLVNFIAVRQGLLSEKDYRELKSFIRKFLPFKLSGQVDPRGLIAGSRRDKKAADGHINLVLAERPGSLKIVKLPFDGALEALLQEYVETQNVYD